VIDLALPAILINCVNHSGARRVALSVLILHIVFETNRPSDRLPPSCKSEIKIKINNRIMSKITIELTIMRVISFRWRDTVRSRRLVLFG
jgi:hypothetical protein